MEIYNRFDIVKVPFPFTDQKTIKKRPALIISNQNYQQLNNHIVMVMITSTKNSSWSDDIEISDYQEVGLPAPSIIRFKFFSLDDRFILGKLGFLLDSDQQRVKTVLIKYLLED